MSSYFRRHAAMGGLAMLILVAVCIVRQASAGYFAALVIAGLLQVVVVRVLGRKLSN